MLEQVSSTVVIYAVESLLPPGREDSKTDRQTHRQNYYLDSDVMESGAALDDTTE